MSASARVFDSVAPDENVRARQTIGLGREFDCARPARFGANDDEAETVVGVSLFRLERFMAGGIAVVHSQAEATIAIGGKLPVII